MWGVAFTACVVFSFFYSYDHTYKQDAPEFAACMLTRECKHITHIHSCKMKMNKHTSRTHLGEQDHTGVQTNNTHTHTLLQSDNQHTHSSRST